MYIDYCKNSICLNEVQKEKVNKQINCLFTSIQSEVEKKRIPINIYLSGSISRREPSCTICSNNDISLFSDIDFVVAVPKEYLHHKWVINLEKWMNEEYPDFKCSAFVTNIDNLINLGSYFGRDLYISLHEPVYQSIPIAEFDAVKLTGKHMLEAFVHQISGYFFHPELLNINTANIYIRESLKYHQIKLVLECLRSQFVNHLDEVIGYCDVYHKRFSKELSHIISPEDIEKYIHARELFRDDMDIESDLFNIVKKSALVHLCQHNEASDVCNGIYHSSRDITDTISIYQYAIVTFILCIGEKSSIRKELYELFRLIVSKLDKTKISSYEIIEDMLKIKFSNDLIFGSKLYFSIMEAMKCLRVDYYRELYKKNIREQPETF